MNPVEPDKNGTNLNDQPDGNPSTNQGAIGSVPVSILPFQFIHNLPLAVLILDGEGTIQWVNAATLRILHTSSEKLIGQTLNPSTINAYTPANRPFPPADFPVAIAAATGKPVENVRVNVFLESMIETIRSLDDLRYVVLNLSATPVFTGDTTNPSQIYVLAEDVTEQVKQRARQEKDQQKFMSLFAGLPFNLVLLSMVRDDQGFPTDLLVEDLSEQAIIVSRRNPDTIRGQNLSSLLPKPIFSPLFVAVQQAAQSGASSRVEPTSYADKSFATIVTPLDDDHFMAALVDVTDEVLKDATDYRELEEPRQLLAEVPLQLYTASADGAWLNINANWQAYTGSTMDASLGLGWAAFLHPDDREPVLRQWKAAVEEQNSFQQETRLRAADGEYNWFSFKALPVLGPDGAVLKWFGVNIDINEQKKVEQRLASVNQLFQEIAENISECFWVVDPRDGSLIYNSPSYALILGYSPQERLMLPNGYQDMVYPEDWHIVEAAQQDEISGKTTHIQYRVVWPDSSIHWVSEIGRPIVDPDGVIRRVVGSVWDVTNETESLRSLKESEQRFKMLAENMQEGFWMASNNHQLLYLSPAIEHIFGKPISDFHKIEDFTDLIHPTDKDKALKNLEYQGQGKRTNIQFRVLQPNGNLVWVWDRSFPIHSEETGSDYIAGIISDITEQKKIELRLEELNQSLEQRVRERTAELQDLYDNAPIGYHSLDRQGKFVRVNRTELEWLGFSEEELLKMHFREILTPQSQATFDQAFPKFVEYKDVHDLEFDVIGKNREVRHVIINAKAEVDDAGEFLHSYSTMVDMTSLKEVQTEIAHNSEKYKSLFDASTDSIFLRSTETGELIDANRRALDLLGYTLEELKQIPLESLILEDTQPGKFADFIQQLTTEGKLLPTIRTYLAKDGTRIPLEVSYSLIPDADKKPGMIQFVCHDLTERALAEEEIKKERDFARTVMNSVFVGLSVIDTSDRVEYINPTMCQFIGKTLEEAQSSSFSKYFSPGSEELTRSESLRQAATLKPSHFEAQMIRHDGVLRTMFINSTPRVENGVMTGTITSYMDVTSEKEIENNLRLSRDQIATAHIELEKAVKMKDEFLASMSHELRTPLTGILGLSEVMLSGRFGPLNEKQTSSMQNILSSGRQLQDLINDILDLSRIEAGKMELNPELISVEDLCRSTARTVEGLWINKDQYIELEIKQPNLKIYADHKRVKQVLVNLLGNAIKFTPEGGKVGLMVEVVPEECAIRFTVWDSGIGIRPEDHHRIFDPFVQLDGRLSRKFSGTGLGLALVGKLIRMHKGTLAVQSEAGKGSSFIFTLPWQADEQSRKLEAAYIQKETMANTGFLRTAILAGNFEELEKNLSMQLRAIGLRVHKATTLPEIVQFFVRKTSMVVVTIHNNLMDGKVTWLHAIMHEPHLAGLRVVVVHTNPDPEEQPVIVGVTHITLPISITDMRSLLEDLFANNMLGRGGIIPRITPQADSPESADKPTLLVVEDNLINREMMVDFLGSVNYNIITAETGQEAIDKTIAHLPDLILMDIQLPGMDGLEATRHIRALPQAALASVPILAVTGLSVDGDREKLLAAGCDDLILKPVDLPVLVEVIEHSLRTRGR